MKKVRIKRLEYQNFKSQTRTIDFGEKSTTIMGRNGSGKSTVFKAFMWLLTGRTDSVHGANHEVFDNRVTLDQYTPASVVKAYLSINGRDITLERSVKAKFVKKRGSVEYEKAASDEYRYKVDDIDVQQTAFCEFVEGLICSTDMLPFCISGDFFTTLSEEDKVKARKTLETLVGDKFSAEMKGDYADILQDLENHEIEDVKAKYKNLLKPLVQKAAQYPVEIQSKMNEASSMHIQSSEEVKSEIDAAKKRIEELDEFISGNKDENQDARNAAMLETQKVKDEIQEAKRRYEDGILSSKSELRIKLNETKSEQKTLKDEILRLESIMDSKADENERLKNEIETLKRRKDEIKDQKCEGSEYCKVCGQKLPEEQIELQKSEFNSYKKQLLDKVVEDGRRISEKIKRNETEYAEKQKDASSLNEKLSKIDFSELEEELNKEYTRFEETDECKELNKKLEEIVIPEVSKRDDTQYIEERRTLLDKVAELNSQLGKIQFSNERVRQLQDEVEVLKEAQRSNGNEIAMYERKLMKVAEYESEKADMLAECVNQYLKDCKVQMFELQKNGERKETCTIMDNDGVKYATLNNSARLLTAISMQKMFCELLDVDMPVFCDECSVYDSSHLPKGEGQYVYMHCTDDNDIVVEIQ